MTIYYRIIGSFMRKYNVNESIFETIDSENKAYWLGFIVADGNVCNRSLSFEISNTDREHLFKFRDFMGSEHPIKYSRKDCSTISICSVKIRDDLAKYGVVPNKTLLTYTPEIDDILLPHFYRGVFDGDGWITARKLSTGGPAYEACFSSGAEPFLVEIKSWVNLKLNNTKGYIIHRKRPNQSVYELHFGGNTISKQVLSLLYNGCHHGIALDRKYNLCRTVLEYPAPGKGRRRKSL